MGEVSRGSCRPASPSLQEGALKAGWLKKQRSIMKNWQLRWFVLRSDQLFFYKDEEETKPQVTPEPCLHTVEYTDRTVKLSHCSSACVITLINERI
uniref:Rho GTPase-activating protein 22 n=1 Tax=Dicentrarchus labrax TaxID=13489 RepID=E6ZGK8_DICLA|nr:Rho GTPase-activating protein 22 [Dicentrarchus labrax]